MRLDILKHRFTVSYIDESEDFTTLCSDANWITALDDMIRNSQTVDNVTYRVFDTNLNMTAFYIKADTLRHNTSVLPFFLRIVHTFEERYLKGFEFGSSIAVEA